MKKQLIFYFILFVSFISWGQKKELATNCCSKKTINKITPEGRCSGNANCTACTTCNYCKYCNSGGSCGVCANYTTPEPLYNSNSYDNYNSSSEDNQDVIYSTEDNKYDENVNNSSDTLSYTIDTVSEIKDNYNQKSTSDQTIEKTPNYLNKNSEKSESNSFWIIIIIIIIFWFLGSKK